MQDTSSPLRSPYDETKPMKYLNNLIPSFEIRSIGGSGGGKNGRRGKKKEQTRSISYSTVRITHRDDGGTWRAGEVFDHLPVGLPRGRVGRSWGVGGVRLGGGRGRGLGPGWIEEQLDPRLPAFVSCHVLSEARPSPRASHGSGHGSGRDLALRKKEKKKFRLKNESRSPDLS